jgi:DmsE family decaheme c-type cytochrome
MVDCFRGVLLRFSVLFSSAENFLFAVSLLLAFTAETPVAEEFRDAISGKDYLGIEVCSSCHRDISLHWAHTVHAKIFRQNPRDEVEARGCEACHGPGSRHIANPTEATGIIRFTRKAGVPVDVMNASCRQCHQGGNQIHWAGSTHENRRLACSDCHNPMANFSANGLLAGNNVNETCFNCHQEQRAQFRRRSHMPLLEGKITCTDCHNPHGSITKALLKADSVNQTCYQCHAEKRGPFLFEHAPVQDNCLHCHAPHGSNHEKLLVTARPMLCQQCHTNIDHMNNLFTPGQMATGSRPDVRVMGRSCQNCHAQVHGSNHPAGAKFHR